MELAITINATGLQPELFDLSRQSQIYLVALRMRQLKPAVKATGMNIQHPTEQTNRQQLLLSQIKTYLSRTALRSTPLLF